MDFAFWDSSALVPLCTQQQATPAVQALSGKYRMSVWWSTPVEMRAAFARLVRMGQLTPKALLQAQLELEKFRESWREIGPSHQLRERAERLVDRYPLKGADAQQVAAALTWCAGKPRGRAFISGDVQLLHAAHKLGFQTISILGEIAPFISKLPRSP